MADMTILKEIYDALDDKKAEKTMVIDISEISVMADNFVITNGTNTSQVDTLVDAVSKVMDKYPDIEVKPEGNAASGWILLDCGDVIVHIFTREARDFYNLEKIWKDGKIVEM